MDEIVEHGRERVRRDRSSGVVVGLAALALLAGGAAYAVLSDSAPPAGPPGAASGSPSPTSPSSPASGEPTYSAFPVSTTFPTEPADPRPELTERTGLTVALVGRHLYRYHVDARRLGPDELPGGEAFPQAIAVPDGAVVLWADPSETVPRPGSVWRVRRTGRPVRIGTAAAVAAARQPGSVWFLDFDERHAYARRHALDGTPLGPRVTLPYGYGILGDSAHGLVVEAQYVEHDDPQPRLVDAAGRLRPLPIEGVVGVTDHELVSLRRGDAVERYDLRTGKIATMRVPAGRTATMSPDRRTLAIVWGDERSRQWRLHLVDLRAMRVRTTVELGISTGTDYSMTWAAGGNWLVLHHPTPDGFGISLWRPGLPEARVAGGGVPSVPVVVAY